MDLKNRVVVVTGAGRGIGRAIALEFGRQGARVVCCGRQKDLLEQVAAEIRKNQGEALAVACDVTSKQEVQNLFDQTLKAWGTVDVLFNNAGSFQTIGGVWEVDPEDWWKDITVNLRGPMLTMQAALKIMIPKDSGVIINMNGGGAVIPLTGGSGYGCGKAGLLRLTDTTARELEKEGSKVIVVAMGPGLVKTEMTQLQVDSEMGRKWIPSTKECFEKGDVRPPEDCARSTIELLRHIQPSFNGRIFGTGMDFAAMAQKLMAPEAKNSLLLRMTS